MLMVFCFILKMYMLKYISVVKQLYLRTMNVPNNQIAEASPSIFDAQKHPEQKLVEAINELKELAETEFDKEALDTVREYVRKEVDYK